MKVRIEFNIPKRTLDEVLDEISSKELKDRIRSSMKLKFSTFPMMDKMKEAKITGLRLEVSE